MAKENSSMELIQAETHLTKFAMSYINLKLFNCVIELGILDIFQNYQQTTTFSHLVNLLEINPKKSECFFRIMCFLVHSGLFVAKNNGNRSQEVEYKLTPTSRHLANNDQQLEQPKIVPSGIKNPDWMSEIWLSLPIWLKNDDASPFSTAFGSTFYDYVSHETAFLDNFNKMMACTTPLVAKALIENKKQLFDGLSSLVDVGGNNGEFMMKLSGELKDIKLIVFDLPHVIADLQGGDNVVFVGGDMFEAIPQAHAVLLKCTLHNWNDENCVKILKQCKKAIPSRDKGGKVIIIDIVMGLEKDNKSITETQMLFDIYMMLLFMTKERNETEWAKIFTDAGFSGYNIYPILGIRSLIEVYP